MMGAYPGQDFVYGFMIEEYDDESGGDLWDFCEDNGFEYSFGGSGSYQGALVVGFKLDRFETVEGGYLGGYHVTKFKVGYFLTWLDEARAKMTPEVVAKIREFLRTDAEPALWTVSNYG